ncbi:MAG: aminoacyl-tRNA hydrolase [bacterium]
MKLIIGLGNPGKKYEKTRHNVGWLVLDDLKKKLNLHPPAGGWQEKKKFQALMAEGENLILAKPLTYMNESGRTARLIADYYKIKPADTWVIHDDLDIPLGKIKTKVGGSSAGHKGVQSIIDYLKTSDFNRVRIGIQPIGGQKEPSEGLVLKKFGLLEKNKIKNGLKSAVKILADKIL